MELRLLRWAIVLLCILITLDVIAFITIAGELKKILDLLQRERNTK